MNIWKYIYDGKMTELQALGFKFILLLGLAGYIYYSTKHLLNKDSWELTMKVIRVIAIILLILTFLSAISSILVLLG